MEIRLREVAPLDYLKRIDGLPFEREPGEAWDNYKARAALWFEQNPGDGCVTIMKVRYLDDGNDHIDD